MRSRLAIFSELNSSNYTTAERIVIELLIDIRELLWREKKQ